MSYLPLIVNAEGGMKHQDGQIKESLWTVPLCPLQDQGMMMRNMQVYGFDFDKSCQPTNYEISEYDSLSNILSNQ